MNEHKRVYSFERVVNLEKEGWTLVGINEGIFYIVREKIFFRDLTFDEYYGVIAKRRKEQFETK